MAEIGIRNRTDLIITAVTEYITNHRFQPRDNDKSIKQKLAELEELLQSRPNTTDDQDKAIHHVETRQRVMDLIGSQTDGIESERIAFLLGIDELVLLEILADMKRLKIIDFNGEVWHNVNA